MLSGMDQTTKLFEIVAGRLLSLAIVFVSMFASGAILGRLCLAIGLPAPGPLSIIFFAVAILIWLSAWLSFVRQLRT